MKIDENDPAAFVNGGAMDELDEECLGTVFDESSGTMTLESIEDKQKQTFLIAPEEDSQISSLQSDRWRKLTRQIRGALAFTDAAVKPNRRRIGRRSTTNIDPFLQKFSTREIGLNTQVSGASLHSIEEELEGHSPREDLPETTNENPTSGHHSLTRVSLSDLSPTGVIDPDGAFLYYWFYVLIFAVRYNLWVVILRFAFIEAEETYRTLWWILDSVADLIYFLDVIVNCRIGFFEEGILVKDPKLACKRYLLSWKFFLDIISILPLEFLYFKTGIKPILRFPRLLKTYKSQQIKAKIEGRSNHPTTVRIFFLIHLMFLLLHWNAGIYFLISRAEGFGKNSWGYPALNGSYNTLTRKYVHSFYWSALTLTTIGDLPSPETNVEYFYTIACYLSGVFVFATIVGNAGSIILDRNATRMEFEKQRLCTLVTYLSNIFQDNAKSYMKIHNVPGELQRRVVKWYDYSWSRGRMSGGSGDLNSLHLLPDKMKTEIALHVHLETLKKVTFLQNCEPEFLHELLLKMRLHIFTPGDLIIRHGEIAREMYLIAHGRIEVISETGKVLKELGSGDFFGEIGILSLSEGQNRRTADVRSIGYTECFVLSKDDVLGEINQFPHAQKILAEYGRKRLKNTSDDPRLVKLDGQDSPLARSRWKATRSHVVNMLNDKQSSPSSDSGRSLTGLFKTVARDVVVPSLNSPGLAENSAEEKNKCDVEPLGGETRGTNDFKASCSRVKTIESRDQSKEIHDQSNETRDTKTNVTNMCDVDKTEKNNTRVKAENNSQVRGSTRMSRTRDSITSKPGDISSCLNTLDYLKAILQSTMHEAGKQSEYATQIECELTIEKETVREAQGKIKIQEKEMQRLLEINQMLNERIKQKDSKISDMEDVLQVKSGNQLRENESRNDCMEKRKMATVDLTETNIEDVLTEETILNISDTKC